LWIADCSPTTAQSTKGRKIDCQKNENKKMKDKISDCRLRIADYGLRIADCGLRIVRQPPPNQRKEGK